MEFIIWKYLRETADAVSGKNVQYKGVSACFAAGTQVKTAEGDKNIEDVEKGDYVLVYVEDEEIITTEEHPFYVEGIGFVCAGELKYGDTVRLADGRKVPVKQVGFEYLDEPVLVYNFEVEDFHTYYVSELGVLVHNTCMEETGGSGSNDVYAGVREASQYLKEIGLPRNVRKDILESFDVRTIKVEQAGPNFYGIRFYGGNAKANGPYLFETFTPQTNRANLALPPEWNKMSGIKQWKIKEGTTIFTGRAAPQLQFGSQYIGGAKQIWVPNPKANLSD